MTKPIHGRGRKVVAGQGSMFNLADNQTGTAVDATLLGFWNRLRLVKFGTPQATALPQPSGPMFKSKWRTREQKRFLTSLTPLALPSEPCRLQFEKRAFGGECSVLHDCWGCGCVDSSKMDRQWPVPLIIGKPIDSRFGKAWRRHGSPRRWAPPFSAKVPASSLHLICWLPFNTDQEDSASALGLYCFPTVT